MQQKAQEGSVLWITTLILLVISWMIVISLSLSKMQWELALIKRNSSNTYFLAKSAVQRQVSIMNAFAQSQLPSLLEEEIQPNYIKKWIDGEEGIEYDVHKEVFVIDESLPDYLSEIIYNQLMSQYVGKDKVVKYEVQGNRQFSEQVTKIQISVKDKDASGHTLKKHRLRIEAVAETKVQGKGYDKQCVEAILQIHIPKEISSQIHEQYAWNEEELPDGLKYGLICCSDILIKEGGELSVSGGLYVGETPYVYELTSEGIATYTLSTKGTSYGTILRQGVVSNKQEGKTMVEEINLEAIIAPNELPVNDHKWCYSTPIEIIDHKNNKVDLAEFYIDEGGGVSPYPTWLINPYEDVTLRIEAHEDKNHFVGWIISKGPVQINDNVFMTGGIIIGGPKTSIEDEYVVDFEKADQAGLCIVQGAVEINYDIKVLEKLMNIPIKEHKLQRKLLDALYLTDYSGTMGTSWKNYKQSGKRGAVHYTDESLIEVDMEEIYIEVESMKQL